MNTPDRISFSDEYGRDWVVTPEDKLWDEVLMRKQQGEDPLILPLRLIREKMGWGWWSVDKNLQEYIASLGVPLPSLQTLPDFQDLPLLELVNLLQQYGSYLTYLESQAGFLNAKYIGLRESLNSAVMVGAAELPDKKMTEKAKEAFVISRSQILKETRRLEVETESQVAALKGIVAAYQRAWDTVSRAITAQTAEATMAAKRG